MELIVGFIHVKRKALNLTRFKDKEIEAALDKLPKARLDAIKAKARGKE